MKKFIIVIVFVFLIAILISFNYLLWDREKQLENFQDLNESKNFTIDTLGEKNNNLDKLNKELAQRIQTLEQENIRLTGNNSELNNKNTVLERDALLKNNLILTLKSNLDISPINSVIKKWVEAIDAKDYKAAQALAVNSKNTNLSVVEKAQEIYQKEIKSIKLKSLEIFNELNDAEHIIKIQVKAVFNVDKPQNAQESLFKDGDNEKYITLEYILDTKEWLILDISDKP